MTNREGQPRSSVLDVGSKNKMSPSAVCSDVNKPSTVSKATRQLSFAELAACGGEWKVPEPSDEWKVVQRKRLKN